MGGADSATVNVTMSTIWRGTTMRKHRDNSRFSGLFLFFFFIAIKAIIIRDSGFRVFPRSNPGTVGFYRSHVQHDRDIIYQLLIFTLVSSRIYIIIFSPLILRILVVQQCVQRESKMYLLQKIIPFIQRNHRLVWIFGVKSEEDIVQIFFAISFSNEIK